MNRTEIERYIKRKDEVAERNYRNYQDSGVQRYETTYRRAEFEADLGRRALAAADEHEQLIAIRATAGDLAARAMRAVHYMDEREFFQICKELAAFGRLQGLCADPWR